MADPVPPLPCKGYRKIPVAEAAGTLLAHDLTEVRPGEFKGVAFPKGHRVCESDICHLQRLGRDHLAILSLTDDEMHEDDAAVVLALSLMGNGVGMQGPPHEGKVNLVARSAGLLTVNRDALLKFNLCGDVACSTLHDTTVVSEGQVIADTRAIPLVIRRDAVMAAAAISECAGKILHIRPIRRPRAGLVITGNEVFSGRIRDAFGEIIAAKLAIYGGEVVGVRFAPDNEAMIEAGLREMIDRGADLLITTGGMSVDPDDVTRFAVRNLGTRGIAYGSAASPGAMILVAWLDRPKGDPIPVIGVPACALHAKTTVFDLILPRILSGEKIGRKELADLGHGGLCLRCDECRYPLCPFGK